MNEDSTKDVHGSKEPIKPYYKDVEKLVLTLERDIIVKAGAKSMLYANASAEFNNKRTAKLFYKNNIYAIVEIQGLSPGVYKYKLDDLEGFDNL